MGSGDFFGEIGILNLDGGVNRRTADVKSVGYAELFVLSKEDVLDALKDHPDAQELIVRYGTNRLNEMKDRRCQRSSKRIPIPSSGNSSNFSIEKSINSCETNLELPQNDSDLKPAEIQSLSVFKNLLNRIKLNKPPTTSVAICDHGNPIVQQSSSDSKSCDSCALANLANKITRESVTITPFFSTQGKSHSRLNSVPSILCHSESGYNPPCWKDSSQPLLTNLSWKESLVIPKCYRAKRRSHSTLPHRSSGDISEETVTVDDNLDKLSNHTRFNTASTSDDKEMIVETGQATANESSLNTTSADTEVSDRLQSIKYDQLSSNKLGNLSNSEMKMLMTTVQSILSSQTSRVVDPLQTELHRLQHLCSTQQQEIERLKEEIKQNLIRN